jgi:anti-sigma factor RsiW
VEDLACQELVELVTEYLDGALPPAERARFEAHVADCPGCARHLAQLRTTLAVTRASAALADRPEMTELLAAFRDYRRSAR